VKDNAGAIRQVALSPDGKYLATASADSSVGVHEVATGKRRHLLIGHAGPVRYVAFSPDGQALASAGADKTVRLWEMETGKQLRRYPGSQGGLSAVLFTPDGKQLVSAGAVWGRGGREVVAGELRFLDAVNGGEIRSLTFSENSVLSLAVDPLNQCLAIGRQDGSARIEALTGY
jgi:WD40 repeat protein